MIQIFQEIPIGQCVKKEMVAAFRGESTPLDRWIFVKKADRRIVYNTLLTRYIFFLIFVPLSFPIRFLSRVSRISPKPEFPPVLSSLRYH